MTQETEEAPLELALVSCQTCDLAFMGSERRTTCPVCGGEAAGPYFQWTLEADGLRLRDGVRPETVAAAAAAPGAEPPAVEAEAPPPAAEPAAPAVEGLGVYGLFPLLVGRFLGDWQRTEEDLRERLLELGAEPEAATIAVGRLVAVRDLMRELAAAGVDGGGGGEAEAEATGESPAEDMPVAQEEEPAEPAPAEPPEEPADREAGQEPAP